MTTTPLASRFERVLPERVESTGVLHVAIAGLLLLGATLPWFTFTAYEGGTYFAAIHTHDVLSGTVLAAVLVLSATLGRTRPFVVAGGAAAAAGLVLWGLGWNFVPLLPRYQYVPSDALGAQFRRTVSGFDHGGGWVLGFVAAGLLTSTVRGAPRDRAAALTLCGVVSLAVAATVAVPGFLSWDSVDFTFGVGLLLVLCAGVIALAAGVVGLARGLEPGRPVDELLVLGGCATASVAAILPWGWTALHPTWTMPGWGVFYSAWETLHPLQVGVQPRWYVFFSLLVTAPLAAIVVADGLTHVRSRSAAVLGAILLSLTAVPALVVDPAPTTLLVGGDSLATLGAIMLLAGGLRE